VACPQCRSWMLPLSQFELSKASESPSADAELWEFLLWGWMAFVYNYVSDLITYESRKNKLAAQKKEVLGQFPNSLICPRCLHVVRK
jgi:hypothetical protein